MALTGRGRLAVPLLLASGALFACQAADAQACFDGGIPAAAPGQPSPPPPEGFQSLRDAADPLLNAAAANPVVFGGAFLNRSHTVVCVLYTGEQGRARALLEPHAAGLPVAWLPVRYSTAQLDAVQNDVVSMLREVGLARMNYVSVEHPLNRVVVSLAPGELELGERITAEHGDIVVIRFEAAGEPV